ncbi:hypothetical protein Tco_0982787 [Tanacetum coccineum]
MIGATYVFYTPIRATVRYKIGNNNFEFGRQEFCLITGSAFGKIPKIVLRLVNVISRHKDVVMLKNKKNVFLTKKTKKIDSSKKIETYNVYGFVSLVSDKIYISGMYRTSKFWWKKDPLVIPRGLAWSKIDGQPNGPITASPEGIQLMIEAAVVHDPQFEQQPKQVVESVPLFTSEELVAEYHSITTTVQLIENVGDGDPSIVLKELAAVKQRMNAIELFIKSKNDNLSEDSVAKQYVEKEIESSDGKADSAISNVLIGEISCQNLFQEQLQSRDMCIQSITNKMVQHPLESPKGKASESEIINVLTDPKEYPSSSMTQLIQAAVPEQTSSQMLAYTLVDLNLPNLNQSFTESQVNEYAEFDFDNPENNSLSVMVKTGEEEIHLDGLETVDDPFVQTPDKPNSEVILKQIPAFNFFCASLESISAIDNTWEWVEGMGRHPSCTWVFVGAGKKAFG